MNKRRLYESIMRNVSKTVKRALLENDEMCVDFDVDVIEANAETFKDNYRPYIKKVEELPYDQVRFTLSAPIDVKREIDDLEEEGIYIVEKLSRRPWS